MLIQLQLRVLFTILSLTSFFSSIFPPSYQVSMLRNYLRIILFEIKTIKIKT